MSPPPSPPISPERRFPAEIQFLLVVAGLVALLALTGLPGAADLVAGDGSEALRRDWAARWTQEAQARAATTGEQPTDPSGLDRSADKR